MTADHKDALGQVKINLLTQKLGKSEAPVAFDCVKNGKVVGQILLVLGAITPGETGAGEGAGEFHQSHEAVDSGGELERSPVGVGVGRLNIEGGNGLEAAQVRIEQLVKRVVVNRQAETVLLIAHLL